MPGIPVVGGDGLAGLGTRYQYAGGWGYESGVPVDWDALADPNVPWDPNAFVPPDDVLGLAGANPALPPIQLLHVGWRWYDPGLGRFVQRDPMGVRGGMNAYLYCGVDPLTRIDPWGLWDWTNPFGVDDPVTTGDPLRRAFINITGGRHSWLDDPKKVDQAVIIVGGAGIVAAVGGIVCIYMGWDFLLLGAMKAGQLVNPRPVPLRPPSPPVRPPSPSWDWWDDWLNDPQFWL